MSNYGIKWWAYVLAIVFAFWIEWYMIVASSFVNFSNAFGMGGGMMVYLSITLMTIVILKLVFYRVKLERYGATYLIALIIIFPIGYYLAANSGHQIQEELWNLEWHFTHDTVYTVLVTQIVVMSILLLGTYEKNESTASEISTAVSSHEW